MTDNDIKKALDSAELFLRNRTMDGMSLKLNEYDIEILRDISQVCAKAYDEINRLEAENLNLTSDLTSLKKDLTSLKTEKDNLIKTYSECQVKNLKELVKRLKVLFPSDNEPYQYWEIHEGADNLLKEMVAGNNGK